MNPEDIVQVVQKLAHDINDITVMLQGKKASPEEDTHPGYSKINEDAATEPIICKDVQERTHD